jgi:hypothetical protein
MTKRRAHGDGGIDPRGPDTWRLRYRVNRGSQRHFTARCPRPEKNCVG